MSIKSQEDIDNVAVDKLAATMKIKLAKKRAQGYSGWVGCDPYHLSNLLREHVEKGDPIDVANFCAFLFANSDEIKHKATVAKQTLSLNRRTHFFIKNNELYIKLQQQNRRNPDKPDFFILKRLTMDQLRAIRDWADDNINDGDNNDTAN